MAKDLNRTQKLPTIDFVEVATSIKTSSKYMYEFPFWYDKKVLPIEEIKSGYYLRFTCLDIPGVVGKIATVLGENNINIGSAHATRKEKKSLVKQDM